MLKQTYVAGTIYILYIIVIQVLGKFVTKCLKDTKQIKAFKILQSYQIINLKTKREKYILPLVSHQKRK